LLPKTPKPRIQFINNLMTEEEEVSLILTFLKIQQLMQQIDDAKNLKEDLINENSSKFEELNRMRVSFLSQKTKFKELKTSMKSIALQVQD